MITLRRRLQCPSRWLRERAYVRARVATPPKASLVQRHYQYTVLVANGMGNGHWKGALERVARAGSARAGAAVAGPALARRHSQPAGSDDRDGAIIWY